MLILAFFLFVCLFCFVAYGSQAVKKQLVENSLCQLRSDNRYKDSYIFVGAEANSSYDKIDGLLHHIKSAGEVLSTNGQRGTFQMIHSITSAPNAPGFWTSNTTILTGIQRMKVLLAHQELHFADNFLCNELPEVHYRKLRDQIRCHSLIPLKAPEHSKNGVSKPQGFTASGKDHGPDDRCKLLYFTCFWTWTWMKRQHEGGMYPELVNAVTSLGKFST